MNERTSGECNNAQRSASELAVRAYTIFLSFPFSSFLLAYAYAYKRARACVCVCTCLRACACVCDNESAMIVPANARLRDHLHSGACNPAHNGARCGDAICANKAQMSLSPYGRAS